MWYSYISAVKRYPAARVLTGMRAEARKGYIYEKEKQNLDCYSGDVLCGRFRDDSDMRGFAAGAE